MCAPSRRWLPRPQHALPCRSRAPSAPAALLLPWQAHPQPAVTLCRDAACARPESVHSLKPDHACFCPLPVQRYHICEKHMMSDCVEWKGEPQRFCQQVRCPAFLFSRLQPNDAPACGGAFSAACRAPLPQPSCLGLTTVPSLHKSLCSSAAASIRWMHLHQACAPAASSWQSMRSGGGAAGSWLLRPRRQQQRRLAAASLVGFVWPQRRLRALFAWL